MDVEVSEVVEGGPQGPARLHVVHLLGQLWWRGGEITGGSVLPPRTGPHVPAPTVLQMEKAAHLKHGAVLEAEALLQQAGDVGHVHAEEGADGAVFGHFVAHCGNGDSRR